MIKELETKMELTISWDDNDVSKIQYGEIWTNGETKFVDFDDQKGVNEKFIMTPHLAQFQQDFIFYGDTGMEKYNYRCGKFSTESGVHVGWRVPRSIKVSMGSKIQYPWQCTDGNGIPTTEDHSWVDRIPSNINT